MPALAAGSLRIEGIRKSYEGQSDLLEILRGVTFTAVPGDSIAIVGPSGCGKSTLLHILGTLEQPTAGHVTLDGVDPFQLEEAELAAFRNRRIGFVFQDHHLLPQYSLLENVMIPALAPGSTAAPAGDAADRAGELLAAVGLSHRTMHLPAEVSGGERQRAAVARALINAPALLLCDEPTGNLDEATADSISELLFRLHGQSRGILILVTHSMELAARCGRRLRLTEGMCSEV